MTRINLVPPGELHDQHLFAEFREIKMVPKSLARSLAAVARRVPADMPFPHDTVGQLLMRIPKAFTLGTGHVSFFYDKGFYLHWRYLDIKDELYRRGFTFNALSPLDPDNTFKLEGSRGRLFDDYLPTPEALATVRARIAEKVALKPDWYRCSRPGGRLAA